MTTQTLPRVKVADEVWIATALLHREQPKREDFEIAEIVDRANAEAVVVERRPGVYVHVVQHCVANRPANPGNYRMLYETRPGHRRLFKTGDSFDPSRDGKKIVPDADEIPLRYADLLKWYREWDHKERQTPRKPDPLVALRGSGRKIWSDEHADEYVSRLREGWE